MMRRALAFGALALMVAACAPQSETPAEMGTSEATSAGERAPSASTPAAAEVADGTIPARFHGVWDYEKGSCHPASDLRIAIEPARIVFYESVGEVEAIRAAPDDGVIVDLAMAGEGETWRQETRLALAQGAERLTIEPADNPAPDPTNIRTRCPE